MRALRERPRLVAARALGAAILVTMGIGLGALLDEPSGEPARQTRDRLQRIKLVSTRRAHALVRTAAALQLQRSALGEARRRSSALERSNDRLRRELRNTQRKLTRARSEARQPKPR
jgi:hypothetical protein